MDSGTQDPYKMVDPNGLQTGGTGSTILGFGAVAASGTGGSTVASALGLGASSTKVVAAGLSLSALGQMSLFCAGLVLIGLGIVLNVMSLIVRWQRAREFAGYMEMVEAEAARSRRQDERTGGPPPS
jgi:hypothetical protein